MKRLWVLVGLLGVLVSVVAQTVPQSSPAANEVRWIGKEIEDTSRLSPAAAVVSQAFQAAEHGDRAAFYSYWNVGKVAAPKAEELYRDWNINSKRYFYNVGAEASVEGKLPDEGGVIAISILPVAKKRGVTLFATNLTEAHVDVIYLQEHSNHLGLLEGFSDNSLRQLLLEKSLPHLYDSQSANSLTEDQLKFHRFALETMKKNGSSPEFLASRKADFDMDESGLRINDWRTWTNAFQTVILNPAPTFEKADPFKYDYREAAAAFRSFIHASYTGDGAELLSHADPSGLELLKRLQVTETNKGIYDLPNVMTHVTVLMLASTTFDGKAYTLVVWRAENAKEPRGGPVALQTTLFVKQNSSFLMTEDLRYSYFGNALAIAGAQTGFWKYQKFLGVMEKSQLPKSFYDF